MAKIQTYVSDDTYSEIEKQMVISRGETGKLESLSSFASMLLELGLRVYKAQREPVDEPFDQMLFNKNLLEHSLLTSYTISKILGINSHNQEVRGISSFDLNTMIVDIKNKVSESMVMVFSPKVDSGD